ncbi:MAG: hypothetical protein ACFFGZ_05190 [Candidatus Thorarchaeota archaeon]
MKKPSFLASQAFEKWVACCDIGPIGLAICTGLQFKLLTHNGEKIWERELGGSTSIGFFSESGPKLIVGCWDGSVREFDFKGGLQRETTFTYPIYSISEAAPLSINSGNRRIESLIVCAGQHVVALDSQWDEQWRFKMPFYIKSCDTGREGQLAVGSQAGPSGGALAQLDSHGECMWTRKFSTNVLVSRYIDYQNEECVLFGTREGTWGIAAGSDGTELHSGKKMKGSVLCAEKIPRGFLIGGRDKTLRAFEVSQDRIKESWKHKFSDVVYCCSHRKIEDVNANLLVGTLDHQLHFFGDPSPKDAI